jgi:hypothetical protein
LPAFSKDSGQSDDAPAVNRAEHDAIVRHFQPFTRHLHGSIVLFARLASALPLYWTCSLTSELSWASPV